MVFAEPNLQSSMVIAEVHLSYEDEDFCWHKSTGFEKESILER